MRKPNSECRRETDSTPLITGIHVPRFKTYFPTVDLMSRRQRAFYLKWKKYWERGEAIDVAGNITYLFTHFYTVFEMSYEDAFAEYRKLSKAYAHEEYFAAACLNMLSDLYVIDGKFRQAIRILPPISRRGDQYLTLKYRTGIRPTGRDLLELTNTRPLLTAWGRDNLDAIVKAMNRRISAFQAKNKRNLLSEWAEHSSTRDFAVFGGCPLPTRHFEAVGVGLKTKVIPIKSWYDAKPSIPCVCFSECAQAVNFAAKQTRKIENQLRVKLGVPRIGEGWVSETDLYRTLRIRLREHDVIQHATPSWLGKQHLDIYIPHLRVAIEYQGLQHEQPVEFFGGSAAYQLTVERDRRKRELCKKHRVRLIYARAGYDLEELIQEILGH